MENSIKLYKHRKEIPNGFSGQIVFLGFEYQRVIHLKNYNSAKQYLTLQALFTEALNGDCSEKRL